MRPFSSITLLNLPFIEKYFCPILAFVGCPVGFYLLRRNQDFKGLFVANEGLIDAFLSAAEYLVPFLCFCLLLIPQMKDKCKNLLSLNVFLNFLALAVPAIMNHLAEYPEFHIKIKDVNQHNSRKIRSLYTSFVFAITSWAFSKTYGLSFECGFFSVCLGNAMLVSLAIVDKTGNSRDIRYILGAFFGCFLLILWRKYLEIDEGHDKARDTDDHSSNNRNTAAGQSPSASGTTNFQASQTEFSGGSAPNQPTELALRICEDSTLNGKDGSSGRDARHGSWHINEHHLGDVPPYIDTSSSTGATEDEEEEDVPHVSKCVGVEVKDIVMTHSKLSNPSFDEGTSAIDDRVGEKEESEVSGQENSDEEQGEGGMRSSTSSGDMDITGSFGSGACEKYYIPILLPKSSILIKGDKNEDDYEHDSSGDERSDGDDSHTGKGCKLGVGKDPDLEEEQSLKVEKDDCDDSSNDKGSDGDGHSGTGCKPLLQPKSSQKFNEDDDSDTDSDDFPNGNGCRVGTGRDPTDEEEGNMQPLSANSAENMQVELGQNESTSAPPHGSNYKEQRETSTRNFCRFSTVVTQTLKEDALKHLMMIISSLLFLHVFSVIFHLLGISAGSTMKRIELITNIICLSVCSWSIYDCWRLRRPAAFVEEEIYPTLSTGATEDEEEEDVPHVSKCVGVEGKDIVMTHSKLSNPSFDEGTSAIYDRVGVKEESEVAGQENSDEERGEGGVKALKVSKPKRHDTLETTWKMITGGRAMPLSRNMKKCDTWENRGSTDPLEINCVNKSETCKDRTNQPASTVAASAPLKLKEPSLSEDELDEPDAFIRKFKKELRMRLQQASLVRRS